MEILLQVVNLYLFFCLLAAALAQRKNVLLIAVDDLRPELTCYQGPESPPMHTPSLDKLAARSLLLKRAYVQQALCSPSRTSLLTGRRPDTTHVYDLVSYFREVGGNFTTIPEYFKIKGYRTIGMGKIFHQGRASGNDDPQSWSEPYYHAKVADQRFYFSRRRSWKTVPNRIRSQRPLPDEQIASHAVHTLERVAPTALSGKQPFFVAVGFHKPHLPFVFPTEFLSLYPEDSIRLPDNPYAPVDMPRVAWSQYSELRSYQDIKHSNVTGKINSTLANKVVKNLRRAYYGAVSFVDSLVGNVLSALESLGLANNTIVTVFGDHGWQLGEHGMWGKKTNFELATLAPMMLHIPGLTDSGIVTEQLTEFVDLFPTLVEAAGLGTLPLCPEDSKNISLCTEGMSLMPLVTAEAPQWKQRVFSQYPRTPGRQNIMGYTMRTKHFRYTEWVRFFGEPVYRADWSKVYGVELYDHVNDPQENINLYRRSEYADILEVCRRKIRLGWRAALPLTPTNENKTIS